MKRMNFRFINVLLISLFLITYLNCEDTKENGRNNILIVYFSCDSSNTIDQLITSATPKINNTKKLAEMIQTEIGGDIFPIITEEKYEDNYGSVIDEAKVEKNSDSRPKLIGEVEDIESYNMIILAYPNWWHTMPMPVFTFLESYDFSDKVIFPVCTHGGGGIENSVEDIKKTCPKSEVKEGLSIGAYEIPNSQSQIRKHFKID